TVRDEALGRRIGEAGIDPRVGRFLFPFRISRCLQRPRRNRQSSQGEKEILDLALKTGVLRFERVGLLALAEFKGDSGNFLSAAEFRRPRFRERFRATGLREIRFSRATESMAAETGGSWSGFDVRIRLDCFCGAARKRRCRSPDEARARGARS